MTPHPVTEPALNREPEATPVDLAAASRWLAAYAGALHLDPPTPRELETLLALAGAAAHASQRQAAPVACWLAARSGLPLDYAFRIARALPVSVIPPRLGSPARTTGQRTVPTG